MLAVCSTHRMLLWLDSLYSHRLQVACWMDTTDSVTDISRCRHDNAHLSTKLVDQRSCSCVERTHVQHVYYVPNIGQTCNDKVLSDQDCLLSQCDNIIMLYS